MFGQHLFFNDLRVPLIAIAQKRGDVLSILDLVLVDVRVSTEDTHLVLASASQVCLAGRLMKCSPKFGPLNKV